MDSYEILMTQDATLSYIRVIRKEIESLSIMPARYKTLDDEPWRSRGIRKIIVKNFFIYYRIDEDTKRVYILNIIYAKRDQLNMLKQMEDDFSLAP